jgi:hypothetical protein
MTLALLQVVLSSVAGFAIFRLWRRIAASNRTVFWLVTTGLLLRGLGGVLAFWLSYLGLPIARSLQIGRGLWVFAVDATLYVQYAVSYAAGGFQSILLVDKTLPAPFFIQTLAAAMLCFGSVISVAILLNLAAYLGCCAIILSFGDDTPRPVVFAIGALSLSPSAIVWSLQPLKDITFLFLVVSFFGAARVWQQLWRGGASRRQLVQGVLWSVLLAALLYGISGIRWYFGAVLLVAAVPFAVMTIAGANARIAAAAVSLFLLLPLSLAAFFAAAGPYIPSSIKKAVRSRGENKQAGFTRTVLTTVIESRRGFDKAGGATIIGEGRAIRAIDEALAAPAPPPAPSLAKVAKAAAHHTTAEPKHTAADPLPQSASPSGPQSVPQSAPPSESQSVPQSAPPSESQPVSQSAPPSVPQSARQSASSSVPQSVPQPAPPSVPQSSPPSVPKSAPRSAPLLVPHSVPRSAPPSVSQSVPPPVQQLSLPPVPQPPRPAAPPPRKVAPQPPQSTVAVPVSPLARILAGTAAILLPHSLAQRAGIVDVRGGQGLWLFVEVDTIIFDIVLGFALFSIGAAVRRRTLVTPLFWMMLFVTGAIGLALVYTVSNFGTLFRHRDMILVGLVLLPLAAAGPPVRLKGAVA